MPDDTVAVKVADEAGNPALEIECPLLVAFFVDDGYFHAFIEIGHLPQAFAYCAEVVVNFAEYL
jgi:hypothetical protein